jgi:hypothetical protein
MKKQIKKILYGRKEEEEDRKSEKSFGKPDR